MKKFLMNFEKSFDFLKKICNNRDIGGFVKKRLLSIVFAMFAAITTFSLSGCDGDLKYYYIGMSSSNIRLGTVSGAGANFKEGSAVTLVATPVTDKPFMAWTHNDKIVSYETSYTFTVDEQTSGDYCALFESENIDFFKLDNITYSIAGLTLNQDGILANKVSLVELSWGKGTPLYSPLATLQDQEIINTGNFESSEFEYEDWIVHFNTEYHFKLKIVLEYYNEQTSTNQTEELVKTFKVNFSNLNLGETVEGVTTYNGNNYILTHSLVEEKHNYSMQYTGLTPLGFWEETTLQNFVISFSYPISDPDSDLELI